MRHPVKGLGKAGKPGGFVTLVLPEDGMAGMAGSVTLWLSGFHDNDRSRDRLIVRERDEEASRAQ